MTLKDVKQTTQMSSHHLLQPPQGHHSHQGCLGNLSHREGPHSLPSHHTTRPIEWSLSSTLHLRQLLGFPSSLLFLSPYWVYVFAMCICLHFQSFSRHLSYLSCTLWNSWSVTYKLPFFLASFCSDWNLAMPQRDCFPWGFRKVWLFFLPQPLYPWFEDFDPYLPLDSCVSL